MQGEIIKPKHIESRSTVYKENLEIANSYTFKKFNIIDEYNDRRNFSCTITAKRCTGKSVLLKDLCYQMNKAEWFSKVFVFSLTADLQPELFNFVKKEDVYIGFNEEKIIEIWNKQRQLVEKIQKQFPKANAGDGKVIPNILLIFDDLISIPEVKNSEILKRLFVAGRHLGIAQFFLTQQFKSIPPVLRSNVDIAIAFYLDNYDCREDFAKSYLSTKKVKIGIMIFENITKEPYQAIVAMNNKVTQNPEESIRTYVASLKIPKFTMGKCRSSRCNINTFITSNFPSSGASELNLVIKPSGNKKSVKL